MVAVQLLLVVATCFSKQVGFNKFLSFLCKFTYLCSYFEAVMDCLLLIYCSICSNYFVNFCGFSIKLRRSFWADTYLPSFGIFL